MDNSKKARVDTGDQIAGYIFMCSSKTKPDCFIYRVFGLPASRLSEAEKIKPNMKLFLFDFDVKLLYGPYIADSSGELAMEPSAFGGRFPSQVKFSITRDCFPLPEVAFKEAIRGNYYGRSKFKQDLSEEQVNKLISLFRPIGLPSPQPPSLVYHNPVESQHPGHRGSNFQITEFPSHGQHAANRQLHRSSYVQEVPYPPHFPHKQVAVKGNHSLASHPYYQKHDRAYVHEAYHPDYIGLYQHKTHARYDTVAPQIPPTSSYYAPNPMPQSHISNQQSQAALPSSTFTASHWVTVAAEAPQTHGGQTPSSGIPSSNNELQLPSNNYYGQTQGTHAASQWPAVASEAPKTPVGQTFSSGIPSSSNELQLPYTGYYGQTQGTHAASQWPAVASEAPQTLVGQTSSSGIPSSSNELQLPYSGNYGQTQGGSSVDMYYNNGSSVASEYQYQGCSYQTSQQVVQSITSVEGYENAHAQVYETRQTYPTQQLPVPQLSATRASTDLGPGHAPTYYTGAYPTYQ